MSLIEQFTPVMSQLTDDIPFWGAVLTGLGGIVAALGLPKLWEYLTIKENKRIKTHAALEEELKKSKAVYEDKLKVMSSEHKQQVQVLRGEIEQVTRKLNDSLLAQREAHAILKVFWPKMRLEFANQPEWVEILDEGQKYIDALGRSVGNT